MKSEDVIKALCEDAMKYGEAFVRIDPTKIYKKPSMWARLVAWIKTLG